MTRPLRSLAPDEIGELCARHFDLPVEFDSFLPGEVAINVLLHSDQAAYVLKAEYPSRTTTPRHFDWVCRVQATARAAGLPVAAQRSAVTPYVDVDSGQSSGALALVPIDGESAMVRLHEFLPGRVAAGVEPPADHPGQIGRLAAGLVSALAQVPAEPEPILHAWAFETTGADVIFTCDRIAALEAAGQVPVEYGAQLSGDLALARAHAQTFETEIRPHLAGLPHQVVHQDLNDFNILMADGTVSGVIDFNDARTAPRVAELAVAAAYAMLSGPDPRVAIRETCTAYAEAAGASAVLSADELAVVEHAAITRLCLAACTWTSRAVTAPADSFAAAFGRSRMQRAWPVIRAVLEDPARSRRIS
jgi:hydroxylysine kinase